MKDPFSILGRGAPIFRAIFSGTSYPIKSRYELVAKAGGEEKLIIIPDQAGGERIYSLLDLLDAFPELDKLFPIESAESLVKRFAAIEMQRRRERKSSPLIKVGGKHISKILRNRKVMLPERERAIQFSGFTRQAATGASLLMALADKKTMKFLDAAPPEFASVLKSWIEAVIKAIIQIEKNAALAAAARAEEQANAAEAAKNIALNAVLDVAGAPTNELVQQAVDRACASADEAARAAQEAANAAAEACAHAGAVPADTEAQSACSRARAAASRAQSASEQAQGACHRARDIASIGIVTICGHVTESDPCCDDDWGGATIDVCNVNYPEIPCADTTTDGNGNYCVTGRFGHSSRVGCSSVRITMNAGPDGGNVSQTKQITVCSASPPNVDFVFDAPGIE
jgi:hypothetical protein